MKIIMQIEGATFKDGLPKEEKEFTLETDCFHSFNEVSKCILQSGYMIKAYILFGID